MVLTPKPIPIPMRVELFFNNHKSNNNKKKKNNSSNNNNSKKAKQGQTNDNNNAQNGIADRIQLFEQHGITSFNVVNKDKNDKDSVSEWIETIRAASCNNSSNDSHNNTAHVCAQYFLQLNKPPKTRNAPQQRKEHLLETLREGSYLETADEILLLSGRSSGPAKSKSSSSETSWSTVHALEAVNDYYRANADNAAHRQQPFAKMAVCYNPYFADSNHQQQENARLQQQLATGCLSKIYFPFGTDLDKLRTGLEFCTKAIAVDDTPTVVSLVGSFVLPTALWMAQQRKFFRSSWKGVALGPDFVASGAQSTAIVVQVLKMYQKHGVNELVWETSPIGSSSSIATTKNDLRFLSNVLEQASTSAKSSGGTTAGSGSGIDIDTNKENQRDSELYRRQEDRGKHNEIPGANAESGSITNKEPRRSNSRYSNANAQAKNHADGKEESSSSSPRDPNILTQEPPLDVVAKLKSKDEHPCILLFGSHDVRLQDNRALEEATRRHEQVLPVFLWTQEEREGEQWGCPTNTAVAVCLEEALKSLQDSLKSFALPLVYCYCGNSDQEQAQEEQQQPQRAHNPSRHGIQELTHLIETIGATAIFWNKDPTPEGRARDAYRKNFLAEQQLQRNNNDSTSSSSAIRIRVHEAQSSLLYDVDSIELSTGFNGGHFATLMPFLNQCKRQFGLPPRPTPYFETFRLLEETLPPEAFDVEKVANNSNGHGSSTRSITVIHTKKSSTISTNLDSLKIIELKHGAAQKWDEPIRKRFPMSEKIASTIMEQFVRKGMKRYEKDRSRADVSDATSRLSPHLRIGTLSPNQLYWRIEDSGLPYQDTKTLGRRLIWRDLAYYQLACFPDMKTRCIRRHYEEMEWVRAEEEGRRFGAWKTGTTGYPIVDAAMRELYATGWMTQSIRMVVASFLVEYLRVNWTRGAEWFHYTLVDADSAINAMMWQNAGRSGIDQWNFVLSPKTASQDPTGAYTRRWVPELSTLPTTKLMHCPWEATEAVLQESRIVLGETYPHRIVVDLKGERQKSIESTLEVRRKAQDYNTDRGYDLIDLPNGQKSIVFTKKEYRIGPDGNLLLSSASTRSSNNNDPAASDRKGKSRTSGRGRKKRSHKPKKAKTT